jgi:hypothetical protein
MIVHSGLPLLALLEVAAQRRRGDEGAQPVETVLLTDVDHVRFYDCERAEDCGEGTQQ